MAPSSRSPFDLDMKYGAIRCVPNLELRDNALKLGGVDIIVVVVIVIIIIMGAAPLALRNQ